MTIRVSWRVRRGASVDSGVRGDELSLQTDGRGSEPVQARGGVPLYCAAVVFVAVAAVVAVWSSLSMLWVLWTATKDSGYTHGPLACVVAIGLAVRRWIYSPAARCWRPSGAMLLGALALEVAWLAALHGGVVALHETLAPLVVIAAVLAMVGRQAACELAVPLSLVVFALPVWDATIPLLQRVAAGVAGSVVGILGITAHVDTIFVVIPAGTFAIESGCSGIHFLVVALLVACVLGELEGAGLARRAGLVAAAATSALVANWLRISVLIAVGQWTHMRSRLIADHYWFGWIIFAIALATMIFFQARRGGGEQASHRSAARTTSAGPPRLAIWKSVAVGLAIAALPRLFAGVGDTNATPSKASLTWPAGDDEQFDSVRARHWVPEFRYADLEVSHTYRRGNWVLEAYGYRYNYQDSVKKVGAYGNSDIPKGWRVVSGDCRPAMAGMMAKALRDPDGGWWCISVGYVVKGSIYPTAVRAELAYGFWSLLGNIPSGTVAIAESCPAERCDPVGPHADLRREMADQLMVWLR